MPDPNWEDKGEVVSDIIIWKDEKGNVVEEPSAGYDIGPIKGLFATTGRKQYSRVTFANGETWDIPEDEVESPTMVDYNPSLGTAWRASNKPTTPTTRQGPDKNEYQWNPDTKQWEPAPGMPQSQPKASEPEWSTTGTSSPYLVRQRADGSLEQVPNPNYKAPGSDRFRFPEEAEYDQLRNQQLRQELSGELSPWQQAQQDYKKQQDEMDRQRQQQQDELARQQAAWRTASEMISNRRQAAPYAQIPGQTHFLGFEPGGAWQNVAGQLGMPFDPDRFRAPIINMDQESAWKRAMGMLGR